MACIIVTFIIHNNSNLNIAESAHSKKKISGCIVYYYLSESGGHSAVAECTINGTEDSTIAGNGE